ncbi:putative D-/L-hydantoinase subunit A [Colletotrichum shisoi]|uniref:Putative D-/L-hydantoinase subunit A n=1 Tax=Colletotrichum shisoi TaxID=2078593 RepID=A0A5Q4BE86_9PEZI|nr:putative D-/L-hydantoinase subunit A [Colletotrichum shisoi]
MGEMPPTRRTVRIGVDVGGTNTDAVAIDLSLQHTADRGVLARFKTPTTPDASAGIETAVRAVLAASGLDGSPGRIASVTIGTTHFINAVIERDARRLQRVAVLRLSRSFLREVPAFAEFPPDLAAAIRSHVGVVDGGLHVDGSQEAPVVEAQVVAECRKLRERGDVGAVVVAGVYSPIDEAFGQEERVRDVVLREVPGVDVVCSREASASIGFVERENAAILNGAILRYARRTVGRFRLATRRLGLECPLFLTQNDGTILDAPAAARMPIRTFSSGPTNSMRGAAYLAGLDSHPGADSSAIVVDIGGTTSDVGVLLPSGMPRQASAYVTVAGVRVNYSMPHLHSVGLGGGSVVRTVGEKVKVGPESVGLELVTRGLVFGGDVCTTTDVAVAAGMADIGDTEKAEELEPRFVQEALSRIQALLEGAVDVIKTSPDPVPVLLVGGGAILSPERLKGASKLIRPPFHDVANAVGAAIARAPPNQTESQAIERAKRMAVERAVAAGAVPESIKIAEIETMPLQYVSNQIRTLVKAVGDVDLHAKLEEAFEADDEEGEGEGEGEGEDEDHAEASKDLTRDAQDDEKVDPVAYKPTVVRDAASGVPEWHISETDLEYLADGCYVLGCAGGGSPAASKIQLRNMLREGYKMRVIGASSLRDDDVIYWGGHMGSPAVSIERLQSTETVDAFRALMEYLGHDAFDAVMGLEIGGANGLEPFLVGSSRFFDTPIIDGDWMGRAYPTYWQTTLAVHAPLELVPCAIDSGDGKTMVMTRAPDDEIVDRALRASCSEMGSRVGMAAKPTTSDRVRRFGVLNTVSLAWRVWRCIAVCRATNTLSTVAESIIREAGGPEAAKVLFRGKIVRVERRLFKGHSYGEVHIAALEAGDEDEDEDEDEAARDGGNAVAAVAVARGGTLKIPFKNENILAEHTDEGGKTEVLAAVPDLISVLDKESGRALGVPEFKYGYRVTVVGITCSPRWTETQAGLDIGGPKAFGYDLEYTPLGKYVEPRSVLEEYCLVDLRVAE